MGKFIDLTGQKFGKLTINSIYYSTKHGIQWLCQCECGKNTIVQSTRLRNGQTKSCGCYQRECVIKMNFTHGLSRDNFYKIWNSIKGRCLNKKDKGYKNYGKRKILICDRWLKFENFRDDMYKSYKEHIKKFGEKNTSIDRNNNNGNYCPENCSWKNYEEQGNNKRNNHFLTFNGQTMTISRWAKKLNLNPALIYHRINTYKWSDKRALSQPTSNNIRKNTILITHNNITLTLKQWCNKLNLPYKTIYSRIKYRHWSFLKSLTIPIRKLTKYS